MNEPEYSADDVTAALRGLEWLKNSIRVQTIRAAFTAKDMQAWEKERDRLRALEDGVKEAIKAVQAKAAENRHSGANSKGGEVVPGSLERGHTGESGALVLRSALRRVVTDRANRGST